MTTASWNAHAARRRVGLALLCLALGLPLGLSPDVASAQSAQKGYNPLPTPPLSCPPIPRCELVCPHGMAYDQRGCPQCVCQPPPPRSQVLAPVQAELTGVFEGLHPHWRDRVFLLSDGTYHRASGDSGRWSFDGRTLTLRWDRWAPESLELRGPGYFVARSNGFSLRKLASL